MMIIDDDDFLQRSEPVHAVCITDESTADGLGPGEWSIGILSTTHQDGQPQTQRFPPFTLSESVLCVKLTFELLFGVRKWFKDYIQY